MIAVLLKRGLEGVFVRDEESFEDVSSWRMKRWPGRGGAVPLPSHLV
jgi:hypothetical protein